MDIILPTLPEPVEEYLAQFDDLFPSQTARDYFRYYTVGLLSDIPHKNIESLSRKVIGAKYQSEHHFLSESPWDIRQVNKRRIDLLQANPQTRMSSNGFIIQDDTGQRRKKGATDGVARQYIGNIGKVDSGMVFVVSAYIDTQKHYGLDWEMYWPEKALERIPECERTLRRRRDKVQIALDQLEWILKVVPELRASIVLADSWYGSNPYYLKTLHKGLHMTYIADIYCNRKAFVRLPGERGRPERRVDEVITLLKRETFKKVSLRRADGSEAVAWAAEVKGRLRSVPFEQRIIFLVDDLQKINPSEARYMVTNDMNRPLAEIVQARAMRNWVEEFIGEAKDDLGVDQAEVRTQERLERHWGLVVLAHTMVQVLRLTHKIDKFSKQPPQKFGEAFRIIKNIFSYMLYQWLQESSNFFKFVKWFCEVHNLELPLPATAG